MEKPTKVQLKILYWDKELSLKKIAQRYGVCAQTILNWMEALRIPRRSLSQAWECRPEKEKDKQIARACQGARNCRGSDRWNWRPDGSRRMKGGYVEVKCKGHPRGDWVFEHILMIERHLGRYLKPQEEVHHRNFDKTDNRLANLRLFSSHSEHLSMVNHMRKD